MIYNTYDTFMIRCAEGGRRKIVDSDDDYVDDDNPLFGWINGATVCGIALNFTPTKKSKNNRDDTETLYLLQGWCKVCRKKTRRVCSEFADTYAVKIGMWVCHLKTNCSYFVQHVHSTHGLY